VWVAELVLLLENQLVAETVVDLAVVSAGDSVAVLVVEWVVDSAVV